MKPRVFGIDYQFLSCGRVFTDGLASAAADLEIPYEHADWSVSDLPTRIAAFAPDLVFIVHGRRFTERRIPLPCPAAVWLLDEPYEVDETASWAGRYAYQFVCDRATLHRHPHATYLPVCYDPHLYDAGHAERDLPVGFIGGGNTTRDRTLDLLARSGLLTYVIGGPWTSPAINALCRSRNIPAARTADYYRRTQLVVNVFREKHHWNRERLQATAMNPRIYEALACGALVVSEARPEIAERVPELPTFTTPEECVRLIRALLADPEGLATIQQTCARRLVHDTYAARLNTVLATVGLAVAA